MATKVRARVNMVALVATARQHALIAAVRIRFAVTQIGRAPSDSTVPYPILNFNGYMVLDLTIRGMETVWIISLLHLHFFQFFPHHTNVE
jgi:hypothetical protein